MVYLCKYACLFMVLTVLLQDLIWRAVEGISHYLKPKQGNRRRCRRRKGPLLGSKSLPLPKPAVQPGIMFHIRQNMVLLKFISRKCDSSTCSDFGECYGNDFQCASSDIRRKWYEFVKQSWLCILHNISRKYHRLYAAPHTYSCISHCCTSTGRATPHCSSPSSFNCGATSPARDKCSTCTGTKSPPECAPATDSAHRTIHSFWISWYTSTGSCAG